MTLINVSGPEVEDRRTVYSTVTLINEKFNPWIKKGCIVLVKKRYCNLIVKFLQEFTHILDTNYSFILMEYLYLLMDPSLCFLYR